MLRKLRVLVGLAPRRPWQGTPNGPLIYDIIDLLCQVGNSVPYPDWFDDSPGGQFFDGLVSSVEYYEHMEALE